ncbi:MAG TPA: hypothetical protein VNR51_04890 [Hyphomicrobium sp.]|nr:hypothetical protein [Hyphomicrobium sp.]
MRVLLSGASSAMNFAEILENASRSSGIELEGASPLRKQQFRNAQAGVEAVVSGLRDTRAAAPSASPDLYLEHRIEKHVQPRVPLKTDPQAIATELSISDRMSIADLNRLRREFARTNHPDRFLDEERHDATRRMMIANMLIDNAVKQRHGR